MELFAQGGMPCKVERGTRVFPQSDHASDVTNTLAGLCRKAGVKIWLSCRVRDLVIEAGETSAVAGLILEDGRQLRADVVILATGGLSYPSTGSTGDGYRMAESLGHSIKEPIPGLVPMLSLIHI